MLVRQTQRTMLPSTLAIVACSAKKMPTPCPAWLLYSASPVFCQHYQAAKTACDRVAILSGKYGLIEPTRVISPYDQLIDPDRPGLKEQVAEVVRQTGCEVVLSYCPSRYEAALALTSYRRAVEGNYFQRARRLGQHGSVKGSVFPLRKGLVWLHANSGATLRDFQRFCQQAWQNPVTQRCQFDRLLRSPFARVHDGRIFYTFQES